MATKPTIQLTLEYNVIKPYRSFGERKVFFTHDTDRAVRSFLERVKVNGAEVEIISREETPANFGMVQP